VIERERGHALMQGASARERTVASTEYGTVTDKRVTYYRKKGWFSGGSQEDVPLRHITSVRLETSRSILMGIFLLLISLALFSSKEIALVGVGVLLLALSLLLLWGSPKVIVNTSGNDLNVMSGFPWTRGAAEEFVRGLRSQLFRD
jgi:hypothetical protein